MKQGRNDFFEGPHIDFVVRKGRKRKVDRIPLPHPFSDLIFISRTGEECISCLVEREGQDLVRTIKGPLNPISMVGVEINISDPLALLQEFQNSNGCIIDITKAGGARRICVMKPASDVEDNILFPTGNEITGLQGCPGHPERPIVDAPEDRIVSRAQPVLISRPLKAAFARLLQDTEIFPTVKEGQVLFVRLSRGNQLNGRQTQKSVGFDQFIGQFQAKNFERMRRAIIIIKISIGVDEPTLHNSKAVLPRRSPDVLNDGLYTLS
jgi:hypothetical protein